MSARTWPRQVLRDAIGIWTLVTVCVLAGLALNEWRSAPLALVYTAPQAKIDQSVKALGEDGDSIAHGEDEVTLSEMRNIAGSANTMILDARPEIFFRLGHIPSALSLPRDDFENQYRKLVSQLQAHRDQVIVVYCSGRDCQDSQMVGDALERLGYPHVRLFRGGWSEWENADLPEIKE